MSTDLKQADEREKRIYNIIELAKQLLVHQPEKYNITHGGAIKDAIDSAGGIITTLNFYAKEMQNNTDL